LKIGIELLATYVPATTSRFGSRFEVEIDAAFLRQNGVFDPQGIGAIPYAKLGKRIGELTGEQLGAVENAVRRWLGFLSDRDKPE
jgi:mRNA interferase MazF